KPNTLLLFYMLLLIMAVLLALAAVILPRTTLNLPPAIQQLMPWRSGIVGVGSFLAFFFLVLPPFTCFHQEHLNKEVLPIFAYRTNWLRTTVLMQLLGVVGPALEFWLALRKARPLPRIDISW